MINLSRRQLLTGSALLLGGAALATQKAQAAKPLFYDYGKAPEFAGIDTWLNSEPLRMADLRGRVVLVDFWTYACINCQRTLPYVTQWHARYKDRGFVLVGVHTPEFPFERVTRNVQAAIDRHRIGYAVAQDNRYATWKAFGTAYWPSSYLIDKRGHIMLKHIGEGGYDEMEAAINDLLGRDQAPA